MTPTTPSSTRVPALWGLLALLSLADLGLTLLGLHGADGRELNPLAARAIQAGFVPALFLKLAALGIVAALAHALAKRGRTRTAEGTLAAWCLAFLLVNTHSAWQLLGGD